MKYCFDIDGTICNNTHGKYENAQPVKRMIDQINYLYNNGNIILLFTARGSTTGIDWRTLTEKQMRDWGVCYHDLIFGKPEADLYIDDKGMSLDEWADKAPLDAGPKAGSS
ncbi:MAG: hypothetical protein LBT47_05720 [Deltaproteobacteria bacterium]|jgi:hypothetical protein|nr:hypothetical protein [Deltaproteobacteria bacterium]